MRLIFFKSIFIFTIIFSSSTVNISNGLISLNQNLSNSNNSLDWTIMTYISADNEGEHAAMDALQEYELGMTVNDNVKVVALVDRIAGYDSSNGDWTGAKYFEVKPDNDTRFISSEEKKDLGEINLGNPNTLYDFVTWAQENYPAKKYALTYIGHGFGIGGMSWDTENSDDYLTINEVQRGMAGLHVDLFAIDGCAMGTVEIAYEFRTFTDYIVFSEELVQKEGFAYDYFLKKLIQDPIMEPWELGKVMIESHYIPIKYPLMLTRSLINVSKMDYFASLLTEFANNLLNISKNDIIMIAQLREPLSLFDGFNIDLGLFLKSIIENGTFNTQVISSASKLRSIYNEIVIDSYHGINNPLDTGMAIYFPLDLSVSTPFSSYTDPGIEMDFIRLDFLINTPWKDFIRYYLQNAPIIPEKNISYIKIEMNQVLDVFLSDNQKIGYYTIEIEQPGIYEFKLDVFEGDLGLYVLNTIGNPIGLFGYLYSDQYNPDQSTYEKIVQWLPKSSYTVEIAKAVSSPLGNGTLNITKINPIKLNFNTTITTEFAPLRGGAGSPISTINKYYSIFANSSKSSINLDVSDHVLAYLSIWDENHVKIYDEFRGNEGEDFAYNLSKLTNQQLLIELTAYEMSGSYIFCITNSGSSCPPVISSETSSESKNTPFMSSSLFICIFALICAFRKKSKPRN